MKHVVLIAFVLLIGSCATYTADLQAEGDGHLYLSSTGYAYAQGTGTAVLSIKSSDGNAWGPYKVGAPSEPWEIAFKRSGWKLVKCPVEEAKAKLGLE
jgi:hypothetical protein